jgi:pimeloyl-ACP methyl ester carboxylesterase
MNGFNHHSGKHLQVDDAKIYYEEIGNETAPVLLFLHGGLGNIEEFNGLISELPNEFRIIGIDNRGHGKSTLGSHRLSYELLQKEIEIVLAHLGINTLTIVGFSNGGTIAYRLAALSNLNINQLITIGAPWYTRQIEHLRDSYSQLTCDVWKAHCPSDYASYEQLNPSPEIDTLFNQAINMALDPSPSGRPDERVQNINCPTLIARGEHDPIVSHSDILELSKLVKNAQILTIPSVGHQAFQHHPTPFAEQLKKFLARAR